MSAAAAPLTIAVLGASGATGRQLVAQALARGHEVHAIVRDPDRFDLAPAERLRVHRGDVHDAASLAAAITPQTVLVSGLGVTGSSTAGTLTAGAGAVVAARPARIVWLGAVGTGRSADAVGRLTHRLLRRAFGAEYEDKTTADGLVLDAGGTVVHAGPLTNRPRRDAVGTPLADARRRPFPPFVSRATVAAVMLDEAQSGAHPGQVLLPRPR